MSGFVKRNKSVNPAGGINPALQPNVGQYGWTSFDAANVNQLIDYVKAAREAAESAKNDAEYIKLQLINIDATVLYFEKLYNDIKPIADNMERIYLEVVKMRDHVDLQRADVDKMHEAILVMFAEVQSILNEMRALRDETKVYKDSAKTSEVNSLEYMEKSLEIYEELKKGQVYRGTWNPNSGAYPANGNTNSVWDVILNAGQGEVSFDGKKWFFGDRLIYVKETNKYEQLEAGTNVKSVNGKTGAVVLAAVDVKALPIEGGTLTGHLNLNGGVFTVHKGGSIRSVDDASINTRLVPSNGYGYIQAGHTTEDNNQKMIISGMGGKGLTELRLTLNTDVNPMVRWGSNSYAIYHAGNKPGASDVGAVNRTGDTMSGPLVVPSSRGLRTSNQSDGTWTALSAENGYGMMWKFNNSSTVNDEFIGIYKSNLIFRQDLGAGNKTAKDWKVYHEGFKPTAADIGAMSSTGGTITGDLTLDKDLYANGALRVRLGTSVRRVIKDFGVIDNNKAALIMFCPVASSTGQSAQGFNGRVVLHRGAPDQYNLISWIDLTARVAYTELAVHIHDQYSNRSSADTMKLVQTKHNNADWVALYVPSTASRLISMDGEVTGADPVFIKNADGYSMVDLVTTTDIVRSTRQAKSIDVTDTSSTGGYKFNTKVAIGGTNDTWLRLNPNNHFSGGIYSPSGVIRHDGGYIQIKNWATGTAKPVQLAIPSSEQYVTSNPGIGMLSVKTPGSNNATRLINVYDDAGKMKSSIMSRDDSSGALSFITHGGTDAKQRVTISDGQVYAYGTQVANSDALTKVSYTEGRYVRKGGDTMTGGLIAPDVGARLTHTLGYFNFKGYNDSYTTGSQIRGYYREHDQGKPGVGWSGLKMDKFTPASGDTPAKSEDFDMQLGSNFVYHQGRKPTADDVGAMSPRISFTGDLNTLLKTGFYALGGANTNCPEGTGNGDHVIHQNWDGNAAYQIYTRYSNGKMYTRNKSANKWSAWAAVYSEANPPQLDKIDAVLRTGDTMTGHLYMENNADIYLRGEAANNPIIWFQDKDNANKSKGAVYHDRSGDSLRFNHYDSASGGYANISLKYGNKAPTYATGTGGTFNIYHEGFKPGAADVGAPVMNSTTRAVELQSPDAGIKGGAIRTVKVDGDQATWMTDKPLTETTKAIGVHSVRGPVYNDGQIRDIYHTGRKPTAADISGVLTRGQWGIGDSQTYVDSADAKDYTEDKTLDFNKLITSGTYSVSGNWLNSVDNKGVAQAVTSTIQVIARKWAAGPTVYQKFIAGKAGDGSRTAERTGTGTYPNISWSKWKETGTYQLNAEYRITVDRPGGNAYPYMTLHKREDRTDLTSGFTTVGSLQFKHGPLSDENNPDSGQLAGLIRADTSWDRKANRLIMAVRKAPDGTASNEVILEEHQTWMTTNAMVQGEVKSKGSNSYRMADGSIGTFWRKDGENLYLMRTESGAAVDGTWSSHRPFSMNLSSAKVTMGNGLIVREGLEMNAGSSPLRLNNNYLIGMNNSIFMRDHGNGNVTLSAGVNSSGSAGDLYLGYNATASGTAGYNTRNVRLESPLVWKGGDTIVNAEGKIHGDSIGGGGLRVDKDANNVYYTTIGGNDTINRGRTIIAAGEAGKQMSDNISTGQEVVHIGGDDAAGVWIHTGLQNGWGGGTHNKVKFQNGDIFAVDGTRKVHHDGNSKFIDSGVRCPDEDCNKAVTNGFYSIYGGTVNCPEGTGPSGSKMIVTSWSSQHVSQTFYRVSSSRMWIRSSKLVGSVVEWEPWVEVYTSGKKPTASDVGALPTTGGTVTGVLALGNRLENTLLASSNKQVLQANSSDFVYVGNPTIKRVYLQTDSDGMVYVAASSTSQRIYHQGYKPTATDVGALALNGGGTVTGGIVATGTVRGQASQGIRTDVQSTDGSHASISAQSGYVMLWKNNNSTKMADEFIGIRSSSLIFRKDSGKGDKTYIDSTVYHTNNKPTVADVGGVNKVGDTMTGDLRIEKAKAALILRGAGEDKPENYGRVTFEHMGGGNQHVDIFHSVHDAYRAPFGLRVMKSENNPNTTHKAWLEAEGEIYADGDKQVYHVGNTSSKMISNSKQLVSEDLDTLKTAGVYHQTSNANATTERHYPENKAGSLIVTISAGVLQTYHCYNSSSVYTRGQYSTGGWTTWLKNINSGEVNTAHAWSSVINKIPRLSSSGVIELGRYIDMHLQDSTADFDLRLDCNAKTLNVINSNGSMQIGAQNSSYAHIYTDRPEVYFNKPVQAVGNITSQGDVVIKRNGKKSINFTEANGTLDGQIFKNSGQSWVVGHGVTAASDWQWSVNGEMITDGARWSSTHAHAFQSQPGTLAPINVVFGNVPGTSDYYPIVRGVSAATGHGYTTQVDFGHLRDGGANWGKGVLRVGSHENSSHPSAIYYFDINGDFTAPRNGSFSDVYIRSDSRLKSNLTKIDSALEKVSELQAYTYDKHKALDDTTFVGREAGIIAQDLQKVLPEAVNEADDTMLTISNSAVNALLVEAIKELKVQNEMLMSRIEKLEGKGE